MGKIEAAISSIPPLDEQTRKAALERLRNHARPAGSLGRLEAVSARLAAIRGTLDVRLTEKVVVTCAGDHGICAEGVSLFPSEVTPKMVYNFVAGGASINVLARHAGARVRVADLGVAADFDPALPRFHKKVRKGTDNFARGPAMSVQEAQRSVAAGIEIVEALLAEGPVHLLGTGDMGIGNTSPSTAIAAVFTKTSVAEIAGRGTGVDDAGLQRKIAAIDRGLSVNRPDPDDPMGVLAKVGGFEIGGLAGLVIGAAANRIPVVCDGLISTAGALVGCKLAPAALVYLFASHRSVEAGHSAMLDHLGLFPLFDLGFRLGEGTGAALAMELIDAATRILPEIRTFEEVEIADAQR